VGEVGGRGGWERCGRGGGELSEIRRASTNKLHLRKFPGCKCPDKQGWQMVDAAAAVQMLVLPDELVYTCKQGHIHRCIDARTCGKSAPTTGQSHNSR
jgi:hypothetical protein